MRDGKEGGRRSLWGPAAAAVLVAGLVLVGWGVADLLSRAGPETLPPPAVHTSEPTPSEQPSETANALPPSPPVRLRIPAAGVNAEVVRLGLRQDGTMEVPDSYSVAGWYVRAPTPGEMGPAVIAGHVNSKNGPAVFYRLRELRPGDRVRVSRRDGTVVSFRVDKVEQHPKAAFPTEKVYGDIDHAGLRLITCGGSFDESAGHYRDNMVVYASAVAP